MVLAVEFPAIIPSSAVKIASELRCAILVHAAQKYTLLGLPSDTKLLLTKNYSEIIIFKKLRISNVIL